MLVRLIIKAFLSDKDTQMIGNRLSPVKFAYSINPSLTFDTEQEHPRKLVKTTRDSVHLMCTISKGHIMREMKEAIQS